MYFYEVLEKCDPDNLTETFLRLCKDSPDIRQTKADFLGVLENLRRLCPNCSDGMTVVIEPTAALNGTPYDAVRAVRAGEAEHYGLELNPWADTLGYFADAESLARYGYETYTALVIWEMTYFGFDEETIRKREASWNKA